MANNSEEILSFIQKNPSKSSKEIHDGLVNQAGYATIKRVLTKLKAENFISTKGKGKGTKYKISTAYNLIRPIDVDEYFAVEIDDREIVTNFNQRLIPELLAEVTLFSAGEKERLNQLHSEYKDNIKSLSKSQYDKELERLAIDLSWKSSQIEGNTYSLLETERLLKEQETADGKKKDEATMLLNHKKALDFIIEDPSYLDPISTARIEDIHSLLIKDLEVDRNIRVRRVGISGTNYQPLDNEFQIREALQQMCDVVNKTDDVFDKAFLSLLLLSYIQAFSDGNKRTARIISNGILMKNGSCPLSFRTIDSIAYKKAMLIFYEQNNVAAFKEIFIQQFEFAVNTYF
ncbi:MAG: Fic family protein [Cytophagales bacterium]|nr:Fic family protein [Cytophagales bacterium]